MPAPPLTHHDILGLVEPFARRGRHVDLRATDRIGRRVAFVPREHPAAANGVPPLRETLHLEHPRARLFRLTRVLAPGDGLEARLEAEGADAAALLACIDSIPLQRQVVTGPGFALARSYRIEPGGRLSAEPAARLVLTHATARIAGLGLTMKVPKVSSMPADLEFAAPDGGGLALTEDLLAVLGWSWARLERRGEKWRGKLRLWRREPARSRDAEGKFDRAVEHLVRTLGEPPARFHERFLRARWEVAFRRALPILGCLAIFAGTLALRELDLPPESPVRMFMFHGPLLVLALFFSLPGMARIELPRVPRRPREAAWRAPDSLPDTTAERCSATP